MPPSKSNPEMTIDPYTTKWSKSTYSGSINSECVEITINAEIVGIRDSKNPAAGQLAVHRSTWRAFVTNATHQQ